MHAIATTQGEKEMSYGATACMPSTTHGEKDMSYEATPCMPSTTHVEKEMTYEATACNAVYNTRRERDAKRGTAGPSVKSEGSGSYSVTQPQTDR
jgi:hypothetical protein